MKRALLGALALVVAALSATAGWWAANRQDSAAAAPASGAPQATARLMTLTLPDAEGTPRRLADSRGRVLVVNFWATWCPPCREEMPLLEATRQQWQGRGVDIVGVGIDEASAIRTYSQTGTVRFPLLVGGYETLQLTQELGNTAQGLPFTAIIDRNGRLAHVKMGAFRDDQLAKILEKLIH